MDFISITTEKCIGCGSCVKVCPHDCLILEENKARYNSEKCFYCAHCYGVCPTEAITVDSGDRLSLTTIAAADVRREKPQLDPSALVELMSLRRSCRNYTEDVVPLEVLEDLVKIATLAPSGTNSQQWQFTLLPSRDDLLVLGNMVADFYRKLNSQAENPLLRAVMRYCGGDSLGKYYRDYYHAVAKALDQWHGQGDDKLFHGATGAILVSASTNSSCPAEDSLLATQNILLAAHSMGLGSCLIGFAVEAMRRDRRIMAKMKIPPEEQIYSVIALGIPEIDFVRPTWRREPTPRILHLGKRQK